MKTDPILEEMWRVKDQLGERYSGDPRAVCAHLTEAQLLPRPGTPLVFDLNSSLKRQAARIAQLPQRVPVGAFLPDDPIIAEVRRVRAQLAQERGASALREEPPKHGNK